MVSATFLDVWAVLSAEIILVLLVIIVFLFNRLRKSACQPGKRDNVNEPVGSGIVSVLKALLLQTDRVLEDINAEQSEAKKAHVEALSLRRQIIHDEITLYENRQATDDEKLYRQQLIEKYQAHCGSSSDDMTMKEKVYISQIRNLEAFKELYLQHQQQHIEAQQSIQDLHTMVDAEPAPAIEDLRKK